MMTGKGNKYLEVKQVDIQGKGEQGYNNIGE